MKKSNPFSTIPAVPTTLSGQWLTFSHMANHYRRLLNVKSRVDSSAPKIAISNSLLPKTPRTAKTKKCTKKKTNANESPTKKFIVTRSKTSANTVDFDLDYDVLARALLESSIQHNNLNYILRPSRQTSHDYEVVFGPSSLRSSTEALLSDTDSMEQPIVSSMGIAEKIKTFLDHAHDSETQVQSLKSKKTVVSKGPSKESRLARHSRCFEPFNDLCSNKSTVRTKSSIRKSQQYSEKPFSISKSIADARGHSKLFSTSIKNTSDGVSVQKVLDGSLKKVKKVERKKVRNGSRDGSTHSKASIGTIRGSEELTEELEMLPLSLPSRKKCANLETQKMTKDWLNQKGGRSNISSRGSNTGYLQVVGRSNSLSSLGILNNKDSSRDSAYGFSSGESRMTTRESTPEKSATKITKRKVGLEVTGKYKSSLSTVASSVNQDTSPVNSSRFSYKTPTVQTNANKSDSGTQWMNEEKYVGFLTDVTEDIVSRGIYTNKGLKNLFKSHIERNQHLEYEKVIQMLDRLRMDVGVPKDDALNQLEFGYGSVQYSTAPNFFTRTNKSNDDLHHKPSATRTSKLPANPTNFPVVVEGSNAISNLEYSNGSSGSTSRQSPVGEYAENDVIIPSNRPEGFDGASSQSSKTSLSETEIKLALKEVGFDSLTTLEIVDIVNHKHHSHQSRSRVRNLERGEADNSSAHFHDHQRRPMPKTRNNNVRISERSRSKGSVGSI